tara:strand:+ start:1497 stop:1754 length:258 start_codon:yes stop_codon:yes gene_type:complete
MAKKRSGKVISVRLNRKELNLINKLRGETNISRFVKESAIRNATPTMAEVIDAKQEVGDLKLRLSECEEDMKTVRKHLQSALDYC